MCPRWVLQSLLDDHKQKLMAAVLSFLSHFNEGGEEFLNHIITGDETWMFHTTSEIKHQSMEWHHSHFLSNSETAKQEKSDENCVLGAGECPTYQSCS